LVTSIPPKPATFQASQISSVGTDAILALKICEWKVTSGRARNESVEAVAGFLRVWNRRGKRLLTDRGVCASTEWSKPVEAATAAAVPKKCRRVIMVIE
jgi:hypothetical protein